MKKRKGFKKIKMPPFMDGVKEQLFKAAINLFVVILFLITSLLLVKAFLYKSDYFALRSIEVRDISAPHAANSALTNELLRLYKSDNIFKVNINAIARSLQAAYPGAKDITVRRVLPDKLMIDLNSRRPVALVGETRHYPVDREGFVIPNLDPAGLKRLPVISGIDIRNKASNSKNLKLALALIDDMKRARFPVENNVARIDAGDVNDVVFYLKNGLEIRIGKEGFKERMEKLKKILRDPRLAIDKIRYIDLRFNDVAVSPK